MINDIKLLIEKINNKYKENKLWKGIIRTLSLIAVFITMYSLILPALTLTDNNKSYTLHLLDSYNYSWKEGLQTNHSLNLYFMDTSGKYIEGKDITLEMGPNAFKDDPYGFGYIPKNGESTRGLDIIEALNLTEYTLPTGEKYQFDHAEVYVNSSWQTFSKDSNHWDIWCQYASSSTNQVNYGWRGRYGNDIDYTVTSDT